MILEGAIYNEVRKIRRSLLGTQTLRSVRVNGQNSSLVTQTWTCPADVSQVWVTCTAGGRGGALACPSAGSIALTFSRGVTPIYLSDGATYADTLYPSMCSWKIPIAVVPGRTYTLAAGQGGSGLKVSNVDGNGFVPANMDCTIVPVTSGRDTRTRIADSVAGLDLLCAYGSMRPYSCYPSNYGLYYGFTVMGQPVYSCDMLPSAGNAILFDLFSRFTAPAFVTGYMPHALGAVGGQSPIRVLPPRMDGSATQDAVHHEPESPYHSQNNPSGGFTGYPACSSYWGRGGETGTSPGGVGSTPTAGGNATGYGTVGGTGVSGTANASGQRKVSNSGEGSPGFILLEYFSVTAP
jgi:hypothetical protein